MASDEEPNLFPETTRIREAMAIINNLESSKLIVVLGRLARAIGSRSKAASYVFDDDEKAQLLQHLHLSNAELNTLLEACSFILEQSSYLIVKPVSLCAQLQVAGMGESQAQAFAGVWEKEARGVLSKLRSTPLGAVPTLDAVDWRVHVQMSRSDLSCTAEPVAFFNLRLNQDGAVPVRRQEGEATASKSRDVALEFTRPQLLDFLHNLDRMQAQLDALGS